MKRILIPHYRNPSLRSATRGAMATALVALTGLVHAGDVYKADNTDNLNLGSSWTNGVPPTSGDIAVWDATVTAANTNLPNSFGNTTAKYSFSSKPAGGYTDFLSEVEVRFQTGHSLFTTNHSAIF